MQVSQADQSHSLKVGDILAPTVRVRSVNTRADIRSGQALLLGGLVQQTAKPAGPAIAANEPAKAAEEVELFFLIMPEIVDGPGSPGILGEGRMTLAGTAASPRCFQFLFRVGPITGRESLF